MMGALGMALSLLGCASYQKHVTIPVVNTLSNYKTGVHVAVDGGVTDRGIPLPFGAILPSASNPYFGATSGGLGGGKDIPEWVEIRWKEIRMDSYALGTKSSSSNDKLQNKQGAEMQIKSTKVTVRSRIPVSVVEEVRHSPPDPESSGLPLRTLWIYFIWTTDGLKMRWAVIQKCCEVVHEGGMISDILESVRISQVLMV